MNDTVMGIRREHDRARLAEEVRQLQGVRELRRRIHGDRDGTVEQLEEMIRERRLRLYGRV